MWEVKKIQDFCPWNIEFCQLGTSFIGPHEQYLAENISLQRSNCIIFGFTDIEALFANEAQFFKFRVFFQACSLLNEVGDPPFFIHFVS